MKRLISIAIAILAVCLGLAVWSEGLQKSQGDTGENTLNLFNWGDYIDPALISKFEKQTGYHVNQEPLIQMKPCSPRFNKVVQAMI